MLTQTSSGPNSPSTAAAAASTASGSATSVGTTRARPPSASTSRRAPSRPSRPRASRPTLAPCLANARAAARPTPAEAPVIATTLRLVGVFIMMVPRNGPARRLGMSIDPHGVRPDLPAVLPPRRPSSHGPREVEVDRRPGREPRSGQVGDVDPQPRVAGRRLRRPVRRRRPSGPRRARGARPAASCRPGSRGDGGRAARSRTGIGPPRPRSVASTCGGVSNGRPSASDRRSLRYSAWAQASGMDEPEGRPAKRPFEGMSAESQTCSGIIPPSLANASIAWSRRAASAGRPAASS